MCFGNNKKQCECPSEDNNYCGGFALDAVLTDLGISTGDPESTYKDILNSQTMSMAPDSNSDKFIKAKKKDDTEMLLPSSIALEAARKGLEAMVYYASSVKISFKDIMNDELTKLKTMAVEIKMNDDDFWNEVNLKAADSNYFIVLVNSCHWVAVKRTDGNNFVCYDPANGSCTEEKPNIPEAIESASYTNIDSLVIALKKK